MVGPRLAESYSEPAVRNFLYFWFPNQCCVFALGGLAYFATRPVAGPVCGWRAEVALRPTSYLFMFLVIFAMLAYVPLPQSWSVAVLPPTLLCVSIVFLGFTSVLSQTKSSLFLNTAVAWIGKLSFSGYLIHWGVIEFLLHRNPHLFFTQATRYQAIGAYAFGLSMVVLATFALAFIVYHLVEQPMIALGRLIVNKIKSRLVAKADLPDSLSGKDSLSADG